VVHTVDACRLLLLGPPLFHRDGRVVPIKLRKGIALAAYLAVEQRAFTREYLAALLWPELGQQSALANLRRLLTCLRETLGGGCIRTDNDLVEIAPALIEIDVAQFQSLLHDHPPDAGLEHLEAAAALYRGGFLEGFTLGDCSAFDEWQDAIRRRMEDQFDELLESLCTSHLRAGQAKAALPFGRRWLELDQLNEAAHRMLMEIHARTGRADLARKQYESCARTLSREGIEPEDSTRDLFAAITRHRLGPGSPLSAGLAGDLALTRAHDPQRAASERRRPARSVDRAARRRTRWSIALVVAGILVVAAIVAIYILKGFIAGCDLSVAAVETSFRGNELLHLKIAFRINGMALPKIRYAVAFSSDPTVVAPRDYVVYADEIRMRRDSELTVRVDRWNDIQAYIVAHNVLIPPGYYLCTAILDPEERVVERSDFNNRLTDGTRFFYAGTSSEAAITVDVTYHGTGTLDVANPLKLFVGDSSMSLQQAGRWAQFVAAGEGRYFLPVEDVPESDSDGSGYILFVIHDVGNDLERPMNPGVGDVSAIYREGTTSLAYGVFDVACGTAISPGRSYRIDFSPPAPPAADAYEVDDHKEIGTVIEYADLPVRQHHTFHDEGTGDTDEDWYRLSLKAGDTLTVETFSAGGAWECDTAIDIADAGHYISTANDKSEYDRYSRMAFTNQTGIDKVYYFQVKPYPKYFPGINRWADYIVEFRR
jgi:DNA-binding SARP family transcriptional activator